MLVIVVLFIINYYYACVFPSETGRIKMVLVIAAIVEKGSRILIAQRKRGDQQEYKWELPGGKLEKNETSQECLKRELLEEFGIDAEIGDFFASNKVEYADGQIELSVYNVSIVDGEFKLNSHEQIKWVTPSELSEYDFAEADKPIIAKMQESASSMTQATS